jgi:hypothetical protein
MTTPVNITRLLRQNEQYADAAAYAQSITQGGCGPHACGGCCECATASEQRRLQIIAEAKHHSRAVCNVTM